METSISAANHAVLHSKTIGEVWDPWRLVILVLIDMFRMHKSPGEVWDPYRLVILIQKTLFCMQKSQMRAWSHRD